MTTNQPNPEAIEAAARAMHQDDSAHSRFARDWDEDPDIQEWYRENARAALSAALPLLPDVGDLLDELDRLRAATQAVYTAVVGYDVSDALAIVNARRTAPDRDALDRALGEVLWNASNYPDPSAVLGRDISALRTKCVDAVLAVLPSTVKPDRDTIARAIAPQSWRVYDADGGREESAGAPGAHWSRERADAVLAVLPGRTEAQVKAEALREHRRQVLRMPPGLVDRALVLGDLNAHADRIERGEV